MEGLTWWMVRGECLHQSISDWRDRRGQCFQPGCRYISAQMQRIACGREGSFECRWIMPSEQ